jgi:hypothetical protein
MIVIGLILAVFAIAFFCWLLFTLAAYALPLFVAVTAGIAAFHHQAGLVGSILLALLAGGVTLGVGQIAFALVHSMLLRSVIALVFAVPAAVAGYSAAFGLAHIGIVSHAWCVVLGVIGALFTGGTALVRLAAAHPETPLPATGAATLSSV